MANIAVTKDTPQTMGINVNRDMAVEVDNTANPAFVAYVRITRGGVRVGDWKVQAGQLVVMSFLKNDELLIFPCGTGTIAVNVV